MSHPSKAKGYRGEIIARDVLRNFFPTLERTGSVAYLKDAADLVARKELIGDVEPVRIVTTQDDRGPLLVTMSYADLEELMDGQVYNGPVVVQVKKHKRTWIGGLYAALKEATR